MENPVDDRILEFIREHHILNLATVRDRSPWCCTCYYAFLPEPGLFVVTSDPDTRHVHDILDGNNDRIAGTIALETRLVGKIRGIQFAGQIFPAGGELLQAAKKAYFKRFPVARLATLHLWLIRPDMIKMTDNRLGFGKKLIWKHPAV